MAAHNFKFGCQGAVSQTHNYYNVKQCTNIKTTSLFCIENIGNNIMFYNHLKKTKIKISGEVSSN